MGGLAPIGGLGPVAGLSGVGPSASLPAIYYRDKIIEIPDPMTTCNWTTPGDRRVNRSSGPVEVITMRTDVMVELTVRAFRYDQDDLQRRLRAWWEWAKAGGAWQLARYQDQTTLTTLASAAAAGSNTLTLTDGSSVVEGGHYVLRDDFYVQVVKAASVSGNTVTLEETIDYSMPSGATFRSEWYWPGKIIDDRYPVVEDAPVLWDFRLEFAEARD